MPSRRTPLSDVEPAELWRFMNDCLALETHIDMAHVDPGRYSGLVGDFLRQPQAKTWLASVAHACLSQGEVAPEAGLWIAMLKHGAFEILRQNATARDAERAELKPDVIKQAVMAIAHYIPFVDARKQPAGKPQLLVSTEARFEADLHELLALDDPSLPSEVSKCDQCLAFALHSLWMVERWRLGDMEAELEPDVKRAIENSLEIALSHHTDLPWGEGPVQVAKVVLTRVFPDDFTQQEVKRAFKGRRGGQRPRAQKSK